METSENINELALALSKAQGSIGNVEKNATVEITTKKGGKFSFQYTTLDKIIEALKGPFAENGLAVIQSPSFSNNALTLTTRILHSSGQWLEDKMSIVPGDGDIKTLGSTITYLKRYAISAMACIASDEDTDAKEGMSIKPEQQKNNGKTIKQSASNGNNDQSFSDGRLLRELNRIEGLKGYYKDTTELELAIKAIEKNDEWQWPDTAKENINEWRKLFKKVKDHALEQLEMNQEQA